MQPHQMNHHQTQTKRHYKSNCPVVIKIMQETKKTTNCNVGKASMENRLLLNKVNSLANSLVIRQTYNHMPLIPSFRRLRQETTSLSKFGLHRVLCAGLNYVMRFCVKKQTKIQQTNKQTPYTNFHLQKY